MKKNIVLLFFVLVAITLKAQNEHSELKEESIVIRCGTNLTDKTEPLYIVDGVPWTSKQILNDIAPEDIVAINVLDNAEALSCYGTGKNEVVVIQTISGNNKKCNAKIYPFKVYCIPNTNWALQQDMYNTLEARVPSLRLRSRNSPSGNPSIQIRGADVDIVIVDGVRYDASILNSLNPNDIESIRVAPSVAATNYFLNANTFN